LNLCWVLRQNSRGAFAYGPKNFNSGERGHAEPQFMRSVLTVEGIHPERLDVRSRHVFALIVSLIILSTISAAQAKRGPRGLKLVASAPGEKSATVPFRVGRFGSEFRIPGEPGTLRVVCTWQAEKPLMISFSGAAGHGLPGTVALKSKTDVSPMAADVEISPEQAGRGPIYIRLDRAFSDRSREVIHGTMLVTVVIQQSVSPGLPNEERAQQNAVEEGRLLSGAEVSSLESKVRVNPHDWLARLSLLSYYTSSAGLRLSRPQVIRARRRHIFWMIQNRPAATDVFFLPELQLDADGELADPEGMKQAGQLWREVIAKHANNSEVMQNAAAFMAQSDPTYSEVLLKQLQSTGGKNPYWSELLGWTYARALVSGSKSPFSQHAREALAKSQDPDILDGAAPLLAWPRMTIRSSPARLQALRAPNFDFAEELAARAISVDAQNPARLLPFAQILAIGYFTARDSQERALAEKKIYGLFQHFNDIATNSAFRTLLLPELARLALSLNDEAAAKRYADEALDLAARQDDELLQGISVRGVAQHDANDILGRVALRAGDIATAKQHLLKAAKATGGPPLTTIGPRMDLAQELLERGERDAVANYLAHVGRFWKSGKHSIQKWQSEIRSSKTPRLNLVGIGPLGRPPDLPKTSPN
jgi:hypothetical protein